MKVLFWILFGFAGVVFANDGSFSIIDLSKLEYQDCTEVEDGHSINLCSNLNLIDENGAIVPFSCIDFLGSGNIDPYLTDVCTRLPKPNSVREYICGVDYEDGYHANLCQNIDWKKQDWVRKALEMIP